MQAREIEVQARELEISKHDKIQEIQKAKRAPKQKIREAILWLCKNRDVSIIRNKY